MIKQVHIPRFNFMNKLVTITAEGEFIAPPPKLSKFKYIGMMNIRVGMVGGAGRSAGQAATIAIRYSCVRRQGFKDSKGGQVGAENCIMDYKMQQYRLFKALGASYLMLWTGRNIAQFLQTVMEGVAAGNEEADKAADELPELHATCAGLKAFCTSWSASLIEESRKCCGGQGFLRSSGIADLSTSYVSSVTAEGEAVILALQTARYLIKTVNEVRAGAETAGSVSYIAEDPLDPTTIDLDDRTTRSASLVALLKDRARSVALDLAEDFNTASANGASFDEALNSVAVQGWHATECHCMYYMAMQAVEAVPKNIEDPNAQAAVMNLIDLTLLQAIKEDGGNFDALDRQQLRHISHMINDCMDEVRPDAVALSDALGFEDHNLKSTLGRYDGNVYEAIYEEARKSPLNGKNMVGWDKYSKVLDTDFIADKQGQRHSSDQAKM